MQLWFARGSDVTIREQLVTQIILGILSEDLAPGQRLPSTRELARRFRLHSNTISAGYRQLEREQWVEVRHGSGVYVRDRKPDPASSPALALDQLIARLFNSAREMGAPLVAVRSRLRHWLELQPPDHFFLIEPDEELRRILTFEIERSVSFPVTSGNLNECSKTPDGSVLLVLANHKSAVRRSVPEGAEVIGLQIRSVPSSLAGWLPAPSGALIGVASRSTNFLKLARTILNAAGFDRDALIFRDARNTNWQRGLQQTAAVACDTVTATKLPARCRAIPFPLLSETSISELRSYVEFIQNPLKP